jgi:hypothetical protein
VRAVRLASAVGVILLFFALSLNSLVGDSPTMDEQNHIARGLAFLRTRDPRLSLEHPPLINAISALPLLTMPELRLPTDHPSWERREGWYEFADLFLWRYNDQPGLIVFLSRLPVVFLHLALGLAGYAVAVRLWGSASALPALILLLFEPNLLAHGRYATTDMGGTLFAFLATVSIWWMWEARGSARWWRLLLAALLMGLAFGSKLSTLGFVLVWLLLAVLPLFPARGPQTEPYLRGAARRAGQLLLAGLGSVVVVWAVFGLEWDLFRFANPALQPLNAWRGPMPTFWAGLEQIALLAGEGRATSFLLGRFSADGFVSYFPVAFLVKTPFALLLLIPLAASFLLAVRGTRRRAVVLLVAACGFFALTMASALNIGYRHALPAIPFLLVLVAGMAGDELAAAWRRQHPDGAALPRVALATGLAAAVAATLLVHPHYLSFFNAPSGGMENGYRMLVDSNVDWGQDLLRLKAWMRENDVVSVKLSWFGTAEPEAYDLTYDPLPGFPKAPFFPLWWDVPFDTAQPEPGIYAISATNLAELPLRVEEKQVFAYFRAREPDDRIGGSILIYVVP